ncbi:hypothetical protein D9619_002395 [Psilocybe cf. subviscida]|uniref:Uncharacterized protein n=1 Tax=Psilocybe cf. subviscida TaxID=2480587 RepID=A0A8H5AW24_9AGAR|nr:hypothetical protein D9619_002395 [Psilocybe cf. subviscida]
MSYVPWLWDAVGIALPWKICRAPLCLMHEVGRSRQEDRGIACPASGVTDRYQPGARFIDPPPACRNLRQNIPTRPSQCRVYQQRTCGSPKEGPDSGEDVKRSAFVIASMPNLESNMPFDAPSLDSPHSVSWPQAICCNECGGYYGMDLAARAGATLPLTIILFEKNTHDHSAPISACSRSILGLIATYAPRLCYLQATLSRPALEALCRAYRARSSLKTLHIFTVTGRGGGYVHSELNFRPTVLHIDGLGWNDVAVDTSILTHVELTRLHVMECVDLIRNSPLLVSCTLHDGRFDGPSSFPWRLPGTERSTRRYLKHLYIRTKDYFVTPYVLENLDFPSLESLALSPSGHHQQDLFAAILQHLHRSGSSLQTFVFSGLRLDTLDECTRFSELVDVMAPTLRELSLPGNNYHYRNLQRQHFSSLFGSVLSRLHKLRSLTVHSPRRAEWLFLLQTLLKSSLAIVTATAQTLSVNLSSSESPLHRNSSGCLVFKADVSNYASLSASDVQNILDIMQHQRICLRLECASGMWPVGDLKQDLDVYEGIIAALGNLLDS